LANVVVFDVGQPLASVEADAELELEPAPAVGPLPLLLPPGVAGLLPVEPLLVVPLPGPVPVVDVYEPQPATSNQQATSEQQRQHRCDAAGGTGHGSRFNEQHHEVPSGK